MQAELDFVAHARHTDPHTSHEAAASLTSERVRHSQIAVLGVLCGALSGYADDQELIDEYQMCRETLHWEIPRQSDSGIRTRRKELVQQGLVENAGKTTVSPDTGRRMIVWEVTDKGLALWMSLVEASAGVAK